VYLVSERPPLLSGKDQSKVIDVVVEACSSTDRILDGVVPVWIVSTGELGRLSPMMLVAVTVAR